MYNMLSYQEVRGFTLLHLRCQTFVEAWMPWGLDSWRCSHWHSLSPRGDFWAKFVIHSGEAGFCGLLSPMSLTPKQTAPRQSFSPLLTLSVQPQSPPQGSEREGGQTAMHKKYDITFAERQVGRISRAHCDVYCHFWASLGAKAGAGAPLLRSATTLLSSINATDIWMIFIWNQCYEHLEEIFKSYPATYKEYFWQSM